MQKLIHYFNPQSRGIRTQKLLDIFEIPHETVVIDFQKGDNQTEDYKKIHPLGHVPAIKHGDLILTESGAITLYLADTFGDKMNAPNPGTPERAKLYEWVLFLQTTMEQTMLPIYSGGDKEDIKAKIKINLEAMSGRFVGPYVLGAEFSMLDVILAVDFGWYQLMEIWPEGVEPYTEFLNLTKDKMAWAAPVA